MKNLKTLLATPNALILLNGHRATYNPDSQILTDNGDEVRITDENFAAATQNPDGTIELSAEGFDWTLEIFQARPLREDEKLTQLLAISPLQEKVIRNALDLYSRVGMGQLEIVGEVVAELHNDALQEKDITSWDLKDRYLDPLKNLLGFPNNGNHGIGHPKVADKAKIAHDIQSILEKEIATREKHMSHSVWHSGLTVKYGSEPPAQFL